MSALSKILRDIEGNGLMFRCPGCDMMHVIHHGDGPVPRWTWNGNAEKPTFSPSVLVRWDQWVPPVTDAGVREKVASGEIVQTCEPRVCHSFVTDGRIQFLNDCTHSLAGQTVDLPPWTDDD